MASSSLVAASRSASTASDRFDAQLLIRIAVVFLAYFIAGKLGQATTSIRSSNLGPVWPAYGVALAAFLACGWRVWPGIAASAFVVAYSSTVPAITAAGQAAGATLAAVTGASILRRWFDFDPVLPRLRDAIALVTIGAFGSAVISASIGMFSLYSTGLQPYSGIGGAWLIYWLGDSTGVLLVTPLIFTASTLWRGRSGADGVRLAMLIALVVAGCFVVFLDLPRLPVRVDMFAFAILPFVFWAAIDFGVAAASLSVLLIATIATVATAFGSGPFAGNSSYNNAVLLDILFTVLAVSGLTLASVIAEREHAKGERELAIRGRTALEARHAQEQERARISRELHDDIGQRLSLLAVGLSQLSSGNGAQRELSRDLQKQATEIATDIQTLSHALHTSRLELIGMTAAMKALCDEVGHQRQIHVEFSHRDVPRDLRTDVSLCLFRVLQEALHNASKYSGADRFVVTVSGDDDGVALEVRDDGAGFDLAESRRRRGLGLISMEERLKLAGGQLTIDTAPGRGTRVRAHVPIVNPAR